MNVVTLRFNGDVPLVLLLLNVTLARMMLPSNPGLPVCNATIRTQPVSLCSRFANVQSKVPLVTSVIMHTEALYVMFMSTAPMFAAFSMVIDTVLFPLTFPMLMMASVGVSHPLSFMNG